MKSSTYYFQMKTKIWTDFQICTSVPLNSFSKTFMVFNGIFDFLSKNYANYEGPANVGKPSWLFNDVQGKPYFPDHKMLCHR